MAPGMEDIIPSRLRIRRHGASMSRGDGLDLGNGLCGPRDRPGGWTYGSYRRLRDKLQSVDEEALFAGGTVWGITLTYGRFRGIPSSGQVSLDREALLAFLRRQGVVAFHWLVEFQRSGHPHLHLVVKHEGNPFFGADVLDFWVSRTASFGTRRVGQNCKAMWSYEGWARYLAKHASRQNFHYQRSSLPRSWGGYSGRMWGFGGDWKFQDEVVIDLTGPGYWAARRHMRREMLREHNKSKPVKSACRDLADYLYRKRMWCRGKSYLRRMFKGLPRRMDERFQDAMSSYKAQQKRYADGEENIFDNIPEPFPVRADWCRNWSSSAPLNLWCSEYFAREAARLGQGVSVIHHTTDGETETRLRARTEAETLDDINWHMDRLASA